MLISDRFLGKVSCRAFPALVVLACMFSCIFARSADAAQPSTQSSPQPLSRINGPIDETRLTRLPGNVPALAQARYDQGEASPSTELTHMWLVLSRSPEKEAAIDKFLAELQDKSSPNYHKGLTPDQVASLYGPADSDTAAIVAWLESHGFKFERLSSAHTAIAFSGTVSQAEEAFHTRIHSFSVNGNQFYSNTTDPSIPSALSSIVVGVARLNTIRPMANYAKGSLGTFDPALGRLVPANTQQEKLIRPDLTTGSAGSYTLYMVPGDAATIYDTPNTTFNANFTSGTTYNGTGVTIGIGGDSGIQASTIVSYRTRFLGDSTTQPTITNVDGVAENGDSDEAYIDTELSGGLAPGAAIHYYASTDLISGIDKALTDNTVDIFSLSFGACEKNLGTSNNALLNTMWQTAAAQLIAVTVSTGDSGSAGCDPNQDNGGNNIPEASFGLGVNGFATTPYDIAVGGTDFYILDTAFSTYVSTAASSSSTHYRSALKYIPESTWNDSTQANGAISANSPFAGTNANIVGAGGGPSTCSTKNATTGVCTGGYPKPSWQRGTGVPADGVRDIPDISLMAGNGADNAVWLVCTDDQGTITGGVVVTADCTTQTNNNFYFFGFGGTSTAAPAFAGILALVQQKTGGTRLGQASKDLYDLYNGAHASAIFHDTTVGNNSVACTSGTPNCVKNSANNYYESGYNTTAGYDLATGIGSVDVVQLINFWGSAVGTATSTVGVAPSSSTITTADPLSVVVTVTGSGTNGTPTGTVTLTGGGYTSAAQTLVAGTYTFAIAPGTLAVGADTLTVSYSGDVNYASKTGTTTVTVTSVVGLSPSSLTFPSTTVGSSSAAQTVTVSNNGTVPLIISAVSITGANASSFTQTNTCATVAVSGSCTITVTFTPTTFGSLTGTLSINASGSLQAVSLSGTAPAGSFSLSASNTTVTKGSSATSTITATSTNGYSGGITLSCVLATSPSGAVDPPTCTGGGTIALTAGGTATATVTVHTTAAANSVKLSQMQKERSTRLWAGASGVVLAGLVFFGIPARRRAWRSMLALLLFAAGFSVLSGCGGSGGGGNKDPGTTSGAYTFTVTGTDAASKTQTTTLSVTVN